LDESGVWTASDLLQRSPATTAPCRHGRGTLERWQLSEAPPATAELARVFERGSYHLNGSAVRYRRGQGGRQPLTADALNSTQSSFVAGPGGSLRLVLKPKGDASRTVDGFVAWGPR
jgi:hypothetical protein